MLKRAKAMFTGVMLGLLWAGAAFGQDNAACLKAAQPHLDHFNACAKPKVGSMVKQEMSGADIIEAAISECSDDVEGLRAVLKVAPCDQSASDADAVVASWLDQARADMTAHIKQLRGQ